MPLAHVGGLSILLRSAICATTAIVHGRFDPERVLDALTGDEAPTLVSLVPTTLARLLDAGLREPLALRGALLGGAPAPRRCSRARPRPASRRAATYGLTEACSQVTTGGAPLFCTRVRIAADGEILVCGPTVRARRGGRPVLATGDLGGAPDGALRVAGRKADTIITGGENVAPAEVEAVLEAHPAVAEAAVHGRADAEWGEAVVATVVLRRGGGRGAAGDVRARLAAFKVPKDIGFAGALPRTPRASSCVETGNWAMTTTARGADRPLGARRRRVGARASASSGAEPVSQWLVEASTRSRAQRPRARRRRGGHRPARRGARAPGGRAILTDAAEPMLEVARAPPGARLDDVEVRAMDAEWIDLPAATVDAIICRWGFMLLADPEAALRETRRVLKPGGRVALAVWDELERTRGCMRARQVAKGAGAERRRPRARGCSPGPQGTVPEALATAGFEDLEVDAVDLAVGADEPMSGGTRHDVVDHDGRGGPRPDARGAR